MTQAIGSFAAAQPAQSYGPNRGMTTQPAIPTGGSQTVQPAAADPVALQSGNAPNVYQQSAGAYNAALAGTGAAAAGPNIGRFMNPYTSMVTGQTLQDLERQRQMAINTTGQQATQAGAFGGSRHGVAEALTNEGFARQGAQTFGNLQQQGFNTALGAAQQQQQLGLQAAGQMGNLANLGFGFGQQISQQQMAQGMQQQALQQALIDAARGQFGAYAAQPGQSQQYLGQAIGVSPVPQTQTTTKQPGLFDYLTMGASVLAAPMTGGGSLAGSLFGGSDRRLKTNIKPEGEAKGIKFYSWDWNEEGKRVRNPGQPAFGVMADELQETHPHLVIRGDDGYLRVNYAGLKRELVEAA
jgi:hypothetical protein